MIENNKNKIEIPGSGFIELVNHMGSDITVVNAARISYLKQSKDFSDKDEKLLKYLAEHNHWSPYRHVQFQFVVETPAFIERQWIKHLVGISYTSGEQAFVDVPQNSISGRYVELQEKFWKPTEFRKQSSKNKQVGDEPLSFSEQQLAKDVYDESVSYIHRQYKKLIDMGVCREQARALLPIGFLTQFVMTVSLQAAVHFIKLRTHEGAQAEIQEYAEAMKSLIEPICPISIKYLLKND